MEDIQGFSNRMSRIKRLFVQQCENSDVEKSKKVNRWPAGLHLVMQVFASLPKIPAPPPDTLLPVLAAGSFSELRLETCANAFGRDPLLAEKANDDL
jgi:hypothetical protein